MQVEMYTVVCDCVLGQEVYIVVGEQLVETAVEDGYVGEQDGA